MTTPVISKAIDPARKGLSKSTLVAGTFCLRKAYFTERIVDAQGRRVPFEANAAMAFGSALDAATLFALYQIRAGDDYLTAEAVEYGLADLRDDILALGVDPAEMRLELTQAMDEFRPEAARLVELTAGGKIWLQGWDGASLSSGDLIGTPDIILEPAEITGTPWIVDIKAAKRRKTPHDLWGAELSFYSTLYGMVRPERPLPAVAYLSWVRTKSPAWQFLPGEASPTHALLAAQHVGVTRSALRAQSADEVPFNSGMCGTCQWNRPRLDYGFSGCAVGKAIVEAQAEAAGAEEVA
ncbi:hypothetical protein UFOVP613_43 [uncultured Caudovirales phage]|uniref:PD-(D/E)XK nuclease superfamily n=1 Tax=uncultured Caudovirales phage TaxID=2100421 RepID=A0A6J5N765_9CAUD|nr:hypothetical protein UFOVP613_43 [uncultured Caudovirales phage]